MKFNMRFKDYLLEIGSISNIPATPYRLLAPFGIQAAPNMESGDLLVGHVLDAMAEEFLGGETIDATDILRVYEDLGASL
jgi:hypothetical protein